MEPSRRLRMPFEAHHGPPHPPKTLQPPGQVEFLEVEAEGRVALYPKSRADRGFALLQHLFAEAASHAVADSRRNK